MPAHRVPIGPVSLAVLEEGAGGRPLLLVHGHGGAKEDFADALPGLGAAGWHAVAPDLRGAGESDKPADEAAYRFDELAADVHRLADALGWYSIPIPELAVDATAEIVTRLPAVPPVFSWIESVRKPVLLKTDRAKKQLGWKPKYTSKATLKDMVAAYRGEQRF